MAFRQTRYSRVTPRHATAEDDRAPKTGSTEGTATGSKRKPTPKMQLTLRTVETTVIAHQTSGRPGPLPQVLRNRKSGLHRAAQLLGMSDADPVHLLLGPNLESTITVIRGKGLEKKAAGDLISHLRWWDSQITARFPLTAASAAQSAKRDTHIDRKFKNFLKEKLKERGLSYEQLAEESKVPLPTVYGWLRGQRPERTAHEALESVAKVLHISLADLMQFARKRMNYDPRGRQPTEYGNYLSRCRQVTYVLRDRGENKEISASLREEWSQFLAHQTKRGPLLRKPKSGWKQVQWPENKRGEPEWYETYAGMHLPSANAFWRRVEQFLGWLRLPVSQGGFGLELSQCQTLAWLVQPQAVEAFVSWCEARAGGVSNTGVRNFRQCVHSLAAGTYGWLRQQPFMRERLPTSHRGDSWDALCDASLRFCDDHAERNPEEELSRNPLRSIEKLRKLEDPGAPVFDAIEQLSVEAASFEDGSLASAIAYRDAAMLAFVMILPVRVNTLKQLTVGTSANHIWFEGDEMHANIPKAIIKNGARLGRVVINGLKSELTEALRRYIELGRPRLVGSSKTELLFLTGRSDLMWETASARIRDLTRRFLAEWVPGGLPVQSFRHLIATRWLQLHPGDYVGAAALLHDRLATVLKTYAPKDPTNAIAKNAHRFVGRRAH